MEIRQSRQFEKQLKKAPKKIKIQFRTRLAIFISNRHDPRLNNHALKGIFRGCRSINITGDWRLIFRESNEGEIVYFDLFGTHSQLYR